MTKEAAAVLGRERVERVGQSGVQFGQGAGGGLSQMRFKFGEGLLNGVEVRTVRWEVTNPDSVGRQQRGDGLDFMGGKVVQNKGVARSELRTEHLLEIDREDLGINRAFDQEWGGDAFLAQGGNEGGALPVAVRDGAQAPLAQRAAAMVAGQLGVQTGFVDKHQAVEIPVRLLVPPAGPGGFDVRPFLLGGARRFFYNSIPSGATDATGQ